MNDFTKEELQEIFNGLDAYYLYHSTFKIGEKIKSMIDNYCEHEWRDSPRLKWIYNCIKCRKEKCKKCGEFYR